ncbi:MAG: hypothetical protein IKA02_01865 [Clostridia bacterium]|nr:hypothetical protein [Clostridia bacterium]
MNKKYLFTILIFHLIVPISIFFPILKVSSASSNSTLCNIFEFVTNNPSTYATVLLIVFLVFELIGAGNVIYLLAKKEISHKNTQTIFLLGFSSAILGAMFISVARIFFVICAVSFVLISYASIKLMKCEN